MEIDVRTLVMFLSLTVWLQFVALWLQHLVNTTYAGPGYWALGSALLAAGFAISIIRDNPHLGLWAIVFNNALFAGGMALFYIGVLRFFGRRERASWLFAFFTAYVLAAAYFTYVVPDLAWRRVNFSLTQALFAFLIAGSLLTCQTRLIRVSATFLAVVFLTHGLFYTLRAASPFVVGIETSFFAPSLTVIASDVITLVLSTLWTFGLILMVNQRLSEESRQSSANQVLIFNTIPDPVQLIRQRDDVVVSANAAFLQHSGYRASEVIGHPAAAAPIWQDVTDRQRMLDALRDDGWCENLEAPLRRRDGSQATGIVSARLVSFGDEPHIIMAVRDISARKEAEAALRDSEERFRLIVQNSPNIIGLWDGAGRLAYVSPVVQRVLGVTPDEVLHRYAAATLTGGRNGHAAGHALAVDPPPSTWTPLETAVKDCAATPGELRSAEYHVHTRGGEERDLAVVLQGFEHSSQGVEVVSIVSDITEHRALEQMLHDSNAALEERVAERTAALMLALEDLRRADAGKDAFLAAVSHELRTPLTGILSMSEMLASEERGPLNQRQEQYVAVIEQSGRRLLATLNKVLRYTELMTGATPLAVEPCRLADLCALALYSIRPAAGCKQQQLVEAVEPVDLEIESSPEGISEMLKALLENAVKFTPEQGRISVTVGSSPEGDQVRLAVTDTGIGMSAEEVAGLFRPFTQVDQTLARRYEGLGIGLAYVRKMAEQLGGSLTVASTPGAGSSFTITLPARRMSSPAA